MAGKAMRGIRYAGWSVDIFENDTKIDKLLDAQGWIGFSIYFFLCMKAFASEGYYYKWCYDDCATTARKMGGGISASTVKEAVSYCLRIGLFDEGLFVKWRVLTSKGIQRSYWSALKTRRIKMVYKELWLLNKEECEGLGFDTLNFDMSATNGDLQATNGDLQATNGTVLNEMKLNEKNTMCKADTLALFERLWKLYPVKRGKGRVSDAQKKELLKIGYDEMARAIGRYKAELEKDKDWRKPQNGSTFFNSGYMDYLDASYVPGERQPKGRFDNFCGRDYDFRELEKKLLDGKEGG